MLTTILWIFDIIIPRFIKEEVAFGLLGGTEDPEVDEYYPICALADVHDEDTEVVMIGVMKSFNLFGFALFPKLMGELYPYEPTTEMEE